ncbi:MAG TPA: MFS transporter, partial [Acidimicrobiaceae bacterium]|nr:MFS transporter [Acidimicrobiaceae bacterium]
MTLFARLLRNSLVTSVMGTFAWFALTFWVYIETRSVVATSVLGGAFGVFTAVSGMFFGTYVDHTRKHTVMVVSSLVTLGCFGAATVLYVVVDTTSLLQVGHPLFWVFVTLLMAGGVAGNLRSIALSTTVTLLVEPERHAHANGMIGTVMGLSLAVTSMLSGLVVGRLGMGWALGITLGVLALALVHLLAIRVPEEQPPPRGPHVRSFDFAGAVAAIREVPGLGTLVAFAAFNNLIGGIFMALMDAYGLELVSVEVWGALWAGASGAFIVAGLVVSRRGLGENPLRLILLGNLLSWAVCCVFAARSSVVLLTAGMVVWMALMPMIEAAEQTVLQRVVPFEQQGRVFGFGQTVEGAAAPVTAFLIGPLAETVFIPTMVDGRGADWIGDWFGRGPERGMALVFTLAGLVGVVGT